VLLHAAPEEMDLSRIRTCVRTLPNAPLVALSSPRTARDEWVGPELSGSRNRPTRSSESSRLDRSVELIHQFVADVEIRVHILDIVVVLECLHDSKYLLCSF